MPCRGGGGLLIVPPLLVVGVVKLASAAPRLGGWQGRGQVGRQHMGRNGWLGQAEECAAVRPRRWRWLGEASIGTRARTGLKHKRGRWRGRGQQRIILRHGEVRLLRGGRVGIARERVNAAHAPASDGPVVRRSCASAMEVLLRCCRLRSLFRDALPFHSVPFTNITGGHKERESQKKKKKKKRREC